MGCDAHVIKPVKRSTLLEAISDAVKPAPQQAYSATDASGDGADGAGATVSAHPSSFRSIRISAISFRDFSRANARTPAPSWPRWNTATPKRSRGSATR